MHDCQATNDKLLDLVFNEATGSTQFGLLKELQDCDGCRAEYLSCKETLRAFDRAVPAAQPPEIYWEGYQSRLQQQLRAAEVRPEPLPVISWWRRLWEGSIQVPLPLAALGSLLLACAGVWLVYARPAPVTAGNNVPARPETVAAPMPTPEKIFVTQTATASAPPQTIIRERVVTRTVYVPVASRQEVSRSFRPTTRLPTDAAGEMPLSETATLAGFQTPGEVRLRVIKSDAQEQK